MLIKPFLIQDQKSASDLVSDTNYQRYKLPAVQIASSTVDCNLDHTHWFQVSNAVHELY